MVFIIDLLLQKAGGWIEPIDSGVRMGKRPSEVLRVFIKNLIMKNSFFLYGKS